jgi:putative flavoprotein involved in K+ transport
MKQQPLDVIIIGAGHAGLSASYFLKKYGLSHIVFERGRIGESWQSQRWDSFMLNTPNKLNVLPGDIYEGNDPDGFSTASGYVTSLIEYARRFDLPVTEHAKVVALEERRDGIFTVRIEKNGDVEDHLARQVIIASGGMNEKNIPAVSANITPSVLQMHSSEYRNAGQLPDGAVMVIGSAQSGCQVAEDLIDAGRKVFLSTSMVARIPRRYRNRDIHDWLINMNFFAMRKEDIPDPAMLHMKAPQLTGVGDFPRTISLQSLSKKGIVLLGKLTDIQAEKFFFQPNAAMHIQFADGFSAKVKGMIDEFISKAGLEAPAAAPDEADMPGIHRDAASPVTELYLAEHRIKTIIWATGLAGNFNYIQLPVLDIEGHPVQQDGTCAVKGLYFIGLHWLRNRKSTLLCGIAEDAEAVCRQLYQRSHDLQGTKVYQDL